MRKIIYILLTILVYGCGENPRHDCMENLQHGVNIKRIEIDSCEYVYLDRWLHKGNCKYCNKRK